MLKLSIMTEQELNQIFGTLDSLIPLHEGRQEPPVEVIWSPCWPITGQLNLYLLSLHLVLFYPLAFICHCVYVIITLYRPNSTHTFCFVLI